MYIRQLVCQKDVALILYTMDTKCRMNEAYEIVERLVPNLVAETVAINEQRAMTEDCIRCLYNMSQMRAVMVGTFGHIDLLDNMKTLVQGTFIDPNETDIDVKTHAFVLRLEANAHMLRNRVLTLNMEARQWQTRSQPMLNMPVHYLQSLRFSNLTGTTLHTLTAAQFDTLVRVLLCDEYHGAGMPLPSDRKACETYIAENCCCDACGLYGHLSSLCLAKHCYKICRRKRCPVCTKKHWQCDLDHCTVCYQHGHLAKHCRRRT